MFFLANQKVQLVINGHDNKEQGIETKIPQRSSVSPILFLIYISGIFDKVAEFSPAVMSLLFMDNLNFIASRYLIKKLAKIPGKVARAMLK